MSIQDPRPPDCVPFPTSDGGNIFSSLRRSMQSLRKFNNDNKGSSAMALRQLSDYENAESLYGDDPNGGRVEKNLRRKNDRRSINYRKTKNSENQLLRRSYLQGGVSQLPSRDNGNEADIESNFSSVASSLLRMHSIGYDNEYQLQESQNSIYSSSMQSLDFKMIDAESKVTAEPDKNWPSTTEQMQLLSKAILDNFGEYKLFNGSESL